jgi:hypothetical protein
MHLGVRAPSMALDRLLGGAPDNVVIYRGRSASDKLEPIIWSYFMRRRRFLPRCYWSLTCADHRAEMSWREAPSSPHIDPVLD